MHEQQDAKLLRLRPERMELPIGELLALTAAADCGASEAQLLDRLVSAAFPKDQKVSWALNLASRPPMICIAFMNWLFVLLYRVCSLRMVLALKML
jgi:hypothetical protein